jgi:hypothetical protein
VIKLQVESGVSIEVPLLTTILISLVALLVVASTLLFGWVLQSIYSLNLTFWQDLA